MGTSGLTLTLTPARRSRTLLAALVLGATLSLLLGVWLRSGWAEVERRERAALEAPRAAAEAQGARIVSHLRADLDTLIAREHERPYFHYQNLMRDPRASKGSGVTPSPLASGPADELVRGYFQVDAAARVTTPTINPDVPALSEQKRYADNVAFRDELQERVASVVTRQPPTRVAEATSARPKQSNAVAQEVHAQEDSQQQKAQVITMANEVYTTNSLSNWVYNQAVPVAPSVPGAVTVVVSPLMWETHELAGGAALLAVREVHTPDGRLTQGFVIDRTKLTQRIASESEGATLTLRAGDAGGSDARRSIAPGWYVEAAPDPREVAAAAAAAARHVTTFVIRFVVVALVVLLAGALVVWIVARAERLARERSQFAAAAAHELRTPLAGLQLYGDMLADGLGDPGKQRDYARRLSEEAARLGRVVSNVLGFSQLERGNLSVDARPGDLDQALRAFAARAEPALDRAGAMLELDVESGITAMFDPDALARIVGNLVDNAEKYSRGAEDRTITLSARTSGGHVEVTVADRGPGLPAKLGRSLFQPFARGVGPDAPAGLGLGLALSHSLAAAIGGELVVAPTAAGASFVLRLRPATAPDC